LKYGKVVFGVRAEASPSLRKKVGRVTCQVGGEVLERLMHRRLFLMVVAGFTMISSCHSQNSEEGNAGGVQGKRVKLKTNQGEIVIELNSRKAPLSVANFLKYVEAGHYDGTVFHRVIADFMIQGGGFALEEGALVEKKTEDPIKNESMNGLRNERGTIAMARTSDLHSATSQFFINVKDNPNLDYPSNGGYAVFGKVVEGMDIVDKIRAVQTGEKVLKSRNPATGGLMASPSSDVPDEHVIIESAKVVE